MTDIKFYVWDSKYRQPWEKSYSDTYRRVADYIATASDLSWKFRERFYKKMVEHKMMPGGRILANAGTNIKNLSNCFVVKVRDSRDSIFQALHDSANIFAWGGGIGYNFSHLREKGAPISIGGQSSGVLSFMKLFNDVAEVIKIRSRRGAMMGQLDVSHPEIFDFINMKTTLTDQERNLVERLKQIGMSEDNIRLVENAILSTKMNHFNISVRFPRAFFDAVKKQELWNLVSPLNGEVKNRVSAVQLLMNIAEAVWKTGDPGFVFIDRINEDELMLPVWGPPEGSNPCVQIGTLILDGDRIVRIGSNKSLKPKNEFVRIDNYDKFDKMAHINVNNNIRGFNFEVNLSRMYAAKTFVTWRTGRKRVIQLILDNGLRITVTPDHKFMTVNGEWKEAKDLLGETIQLSHRKLFKRNRSYYDFLSVLLGYMAFGAKKERGKFFFENIEGIEPFLYEGGWNGKVPFKESKDFRFLSTVYARSMLIFSSKEKLLDFIDGFEFIHDFIAGLFHAVGKYENCYAVFEFYDEQIASGVQEILSTMGFSTRLETEEENYKVIVFNTDDFINVIRPFVSSTCVKNDYIEPKVIDIKNAGYGEVWDFKMNDSSGWNNVLGLMCHNCSELYLYPYEACTLTSVNLVNHTKKVDGKWEIDWDELFDTVFVATVFLDSVVELDQHLVKDIEETQSYLRRIGLGVMGWADLLVRLEIPYGSEESLELAKKLMAFISYVAISTSNYLASILEPAPFWMNHKNELNYHFLEKIEHYKLDDKVREVLNRNLIGRSMNEVRGPFNVYLLRNVSWTSIAPTGSIAIMAECSHSIEPYYKLVYKRNLELGEDKLQKTVWVENTEIRKKLEEWGVNVDEFYERVFAGEQPVDILGERGRIFVDAQSLSPKQHIDMQDAFQEFTSNSISKTINMPNETTVREIFDTIIYMNDARIKSSTIYRDGSKLFQILE